MSITFHLLTSYKQDLKKNFEAAGFAPEVKPLVEFQEDYGLEGEEEEIDEDEDDEEDGESDEMEE